MYFTFWLVCTLRSTKSFNVKFSCHVNINYSKITPLLPKRISIFCTKDRKTYNIQSINSLGSAIYQKIDI